MPCRVLLDHCEFDSTASVRIANFNRIGAAVTDRLSSSTAWRYVFLVHLVAMVILMLFVRVGLPTYNKAVSNYRSSRISVQGPQNRLWYILPVVDLLLPVAATVCFEIALYQGALRGWYQSQVISLFAAGSGGCLAVLLVKRIFFARSYPRSYPYVHHSHRDGQFWLQVWILLLSFSWDASYYTFIHYMRKSMCRDICNGS
jgi:hypothetical protein